MMRKLFLIFSFFIFSFSLCIAQDTLVMRNGKKIVGKVISVNKEKVIYSIPPDSTPKSVSVWRMEYIAYPGGTKFNFTEKKKTTIKASTTSWYLSADGGFNVPSLSYRDAIAGTHFNVGSTYYFNNHMGLAVRVGEDLNGTGLNYISNNYWGGFYIFQEYLAGLSYRLGGRPGYPWVDFVGIGGLCNVLNPVSEQGGGENGLTVNTPGTGKGFGGYVGMEFTSSSDHTCSFTFGLGCFGAVFNNPNYTSNFSLYDPYSNSTSNTVSKSTLKTSVVLYQMHFALNFRLKKAGWR